MKKVIAVTAVVLCATGCSSVGVHRMFDSDDNGWVMLSGDAEGVRAYNDGLVGHITEARNNPDVKSAYWQNREKETTVRGLRFQVKKGGAK